MDKNKMPDMDEMIASCKEKMTENDVLCFGFGVGRMLPKLGFIRQQKKALKLINSLKGFIGVNPLDLWRNILIFDSLNNAKEGRNILKFKGVQVGQVVPLIVNKIYVEESKKYREASLQEREEGSR